MLRRSGDIIIYELAFFLGQLVTETPPTKDDFFVGNRLRQATQTRAVPLI